MLSLYGRDQVIRNVFRLAKVEQPDASIQKISDLRGVYLDFLDRRQRGVLTDRPEGFFVEDARLEETLSRAFTEGELNDLNQADLLGSPYGTHTRQVKSEFARQVLADLLELDDDFATVFSLVIHSIFVRPSKPVAGISGSHGGSTSGAIGAIWLTVVDDMRPLDLMEMYVHELTHHLLFIDELNHPQFNYKAIARKENFATSAILRRSRPLDKVIHSVVVAAELLEARRAFLANNGKTLIHPPSQALASDGLIAIASVNALPNLSDLITPHLSEVVERCRQVFEQSTASHVSA